MIYGIDPIKLILSKNDAHISILPINSSNKVGSEWESSKRLWKLTKILCARAITYTKSKFLISDIKNKGLTYGIKGTYDIGENSLFKTMVMGCSYQIQPVAISKRGQLDSR